MKPIDFRASILALSLPVLLVLAACDSPEERAAMHMQRGVELFEAHNYDKARLEFRNTLQLQPASGDAYYYLGRIFDAQEMIPEAVRSFAAAVAQDPNHQDAAIRLARYYVLGGGYDEALKLAEKVMEVSNSENAEAFALRSSVRAATGDLKGAEGDARRALVLDPASIMASAALAGVYQRLGESELAIETIAVGIERNPSDTSLRLAKLNFHLAQGHRSEAESEAKAIVAIEPDRVWNRIQLARLYVDWNRLDDAEAVLRDGAEVRPATTEAKLALVDFLSNRRSVLAARTALDSYISSVPKEFQLRFALAEMLRRNGQAVEAKTVLGDIITAGNGTPSAINAQAGLAGLVHAEGNVEEAKKLIGEVLKSEAENPQALLLRGRIQFDEGQVADAIDSMRSVLRNVPDSVPALTVLSHAYMRNGQWQLAAETLRKQVAADVRNPMPSVQLAQLLATNNQPGSAVKVLNEALTRQPNDLATLATKFDILLAMGKTAEARTSAGPINDQANGRALYLTLMGRAAQAEGHHDEAIAAFQFARDADPKQWAPVNGMVRSMTTRGEFDAAGTVLREILQQNPRDVTARLRLGDVLSARGDLPGALEAYRQVLGQQPGDVTASTRAVGAHFLMGEEDKALAVLASAAAANPKETNLRTALAFAYERAGRIPEAIATYEALNSENTRNVLVANNLAALIADHEYDKPARLTQAIKMMEPLQATDNANIVDTIGWLHLRAGRTAEALSYLKRAVSLDPKNPLLRRHLGEAYQLAGDLETARRYLAETP